MERSVFALSMIAVWPVTVSDSLTLDSRIVTFKSEAAPTCSLMSDCTNFAKPSSSAVIE